MPPFGCVRDCRIGLKGEARQIVLQPRDAIGRTVHCRHPRAGVDELRGLAAGRGAEIGNGLVFNVTEQPGRHGGGGVLHPPLAVVETGKHGHRTMQQRPHRAGGQRLAVQARCPALGVRFHRQIECRFDADGIGHRARGVLAIGRDPARHQPGRQIEHLRFHFIDQWLAFTRAAPQHGVDEAGIFRRAAVRLHETDREIDGGVIRNVHP